MESKASLTVNGWQVDAERFCISRDGAEVKLEPRSMELLLYLAERPGQVVTRQQIEDDVWQGRIVGYDALSGAIAKIRRAFDDSIKNPRVIETIPKAGYRLIAPVFDLPGDKSARNTQSPVPTDAVPAREVAVPDDPIPRSRSPTRSLPEQDSKRRSTSIAIVIAGIFAIAAAAYALRFGIPDVDRGEGTGVDPTVPPTASLAVLPFRSLSSDQDQQFYSDGLTDDLITDLSNIDGLQVAPHHSSTFFAGENLPPQQVARKLRVRYLVQGSVRRSFQDIRVNIQVIDTQNDQSAWSRRFDDRIDNVFKLQDQIVSAIIQHVGLDPAQKSRSLRSTTNLEAYDYFLRAEHRRQHDSTADRDGQTLELYRRAIELDPTYVSAYIGLGREALNNWQLDASQIMPAAASKKLVYESAGKALGLEPGNAEALAVLGLLQSVSGEHDAGIASVENALALDPGNPQLQVDFSIVLSYSGRHQEALESIESALAGGSAPTPSYFAERARINFFLGRFRKAIKDAERAFAAGDIRNFALFSHGALGDEANAQKSLNLRLQQNPWENLEYYRTIFAYYRRPKDIRLLVDSAAKAGVPGLAFGFDPGKREALGNSQIRQLTAGKLWHGSNHPGDNFFAHFSPGNRIALRTPELILSGIYHVEGGRLCVSLRAVRFDLPDCGPVYQVEADGSYTWVTLGDVYRFAIE